MQSYVPLRPILLVDPVTQVNDPIGFGIVQTGDQVSYKTWTTNSISNSSLQFSAPPPSGNIIVDRMVLCTVPCRLTFAGTITTSNNSFQPATSLLVAGMDAPRAWTILSAMESLIVTINGTAVSIQMSDVIHALGHFNTPEIIKAKDMSTQPNYFDPTSNYSDAPVGTARNPLGNYDNTPNEEVPQRGASIFTVVSNAAVTPTTGGVAASAIVDMLISFWLPISPLHFSSICSNKQGLYNINSWDTTMNFLSGTPGGNRMWSSSNAALAVSGGISVTRSFGSIIPQFSNFSGTAFSYSGYAQPTLQFRYISPNVLSKELLGPLIPISYNYTQVERFPTELGAITYASGVQQVQSQNVQLPQIPRSVLIYGRIQNQVLQGANGNMLTDCYLGINNIAIQWTNNPSLLSTASAQQLYFMSVANGIDMSWNQWSALPVNNSAFTGTAGAAMFSGSGSIVKLNFGSEIQLAPSDSVGKGGQYNFQVQVGLFNPNVGGQWDTLNMTLYVVFIYEGTFTVTQLGSAISQLSVVTSQDVLDAASLPGLNYRTAMAEGGDFFSGLKNFFGKIHDFAKGNKLISSYSPTIGNALQNVGVPFASTIGSTVGHVARELGYGEGIRHTRSRRGHGGQLLNGGAILHRR